MSLRVATISILALAIAVVPASATIAYCNSGCLSPGGSNAGMTYATFESVASAFTFPAAPITFISGGLSVAGVYTDTSGTVFTGLINASADPLALSGTKLIQTGNTAGGTRSIAITLPADTYAFGMFVSSAAGTGATPNVDIVPVSGSSDWTLSTYSGATPFFGIISDTPITNLYLGNYLGGGALAIDSFILGTEGAPPSEAPEAPAFLLTGAGLMLLRRLRRRQTIQPS
jgi:hypothetical protein